MASPSRNISNIGFLISTLGLAWFLSSQILCKDNVLENFILERLNIHFVSIMAYPSDHMSLHLLKNGISE